MSGRFSVRDPLENRPDPVNEARRNAEHDRARAEQVIRALMKMQTEDAWAREQILPLTDWQRDALFRVLQRLNED